MGNRKLDKKPAPSSPSASKDAMCEHCSLKCIASDCDCDCHKPTSPEVKK